jgi:hypothetical protein
MPDLLRIEQAQAAEPGLPSRAAPMMSLMRNPTVPETKMAGNPLRRLQAVRRTH